VSPTPILDPMMSDGPFVTEQWNTYINFVKHSVSDQAASQLASTGEMEDGTPRPKQFIARTLRANQRVFHEFLSKLQDKNRNITHLQGLYRINLLIKPNQQFRVVPGQIS
jgi:hypothetical protein